MGRHALAFSIVSGFFVACGGDADGVDRPPETAEDLVTVDEDAAIAIAVLANDVDPEGRPLRLVRASAVGHEVTVDEDLVRVATVEHWHGTIEVDYVVSDGARSATGRAVVTVTPVNDAPVATAAAIATGRGVAKVLELGGADVDGDALTFEIVSGPAHGTLAGEAPSLTYTPEAGYIGEDAVTFVARDAALASAAATIAITVAAGAPPVAQPQAVTTPEDTSVAITLAATDGDGDALTYAIVQPPAHGTLAGTPPAVTYVPEANYHGPDSFTFTAGDGVLTSSPAMVAVTVTGVNDAPIAHVQLVPATEDTPVTIVLTGVDLDGDALTYGIVDAPTGGALTGTGAIRTYHPAANQHGEDAFTFTVSDGALTSAPATVRITIAPVEDAPVAVAQALTTAEDTALAVTLAGSDPDGDPVTFAITGQPAHGTLAGTPPTVTYTPAANYHGPDTFTFTTDDGDQPSAPATVTITVTPVDDPPVLVGATVTGSEDDFIAFPLPATDVDGETLTYSVTTFPAHGSIHGTGNARSYRQHADYAATDMVAFTASDGHTTSAPAFFTIAITPLPDPPLARDDLAIATPGQPLRIDVLANDHELDGEELILASVDAPSHGTADLDGDEVVFTPSPGVTTPARFTYTVADPTGLTATATVTVGIGEFPGGLATWHVGRVVHVASAWSQVLQHDVSADGRFAAMLSAYALTPGDSNGVPDVYVCDRLTWTFERVSVAADGGLANGASERPSISGDGRYVAFASAATNLVAGDTNGAVDVFVRDRQTGTTVRASVGPGGAQVSGISRQPVLSADGTVVAFVSGAFQLVADDANGASDVFVRDLVAATTTRVSVRTGGGEAELESSGPVLSGDGRVVAFTSTASNLVAGDTNGAPDVFVHDRTSGVTERVSVSSTGGEGDGSSYGAAVSFDGRFVAFGTNATNLVPGVTGGGTFVRDRQAVTTTQAMGRLGSFSLSGDGRYLAGHGSDGSSFVRDRFAGVTHWYSPPNGHDIFFPVLARNGRYVGLLSNAGLTPGAGTGTRLYLVANPL